MFWDLRSRLQPFPNLHRQSFAMSVDWCLFDVVTTTVKRKGVVTTTTEIMKCCSPKI